MKYEDIDCCDIEGNKFKVTKIVTGHMQKQRCRIMSCAYLDGLECSHVEIKSSKELCVKYVISCINNKNEYSDFKNWYFEDEIKNLIGIPDDDNMIVYNDTDKKWNSVHAPNSDKEFRLSCWKPNHFNLGVSPNDCCNNKYVKAHMLLHYFVGEKGC